MATRQESLDGMIVKVCGIPYTVKECDENFSYDEHFGRIVYSECIIKISKCMPIEMKKEVLYHEMIHGILYYTGQYDTHNCEELVQALAIAIYNSFELKEFLDGNK